MKNLRVYLIGLFVCLVPISIHAAEGSTSSTDQLFEQAAKRLEVVVDSQIKFLEANNQFRSLSRFSQAKKRESRKDIKELSRIHG